jgi:hypothetical protein
MRTASLARNPYAPPAATLDDAPPATAAPPMWNPNAAVNWSLLLTPAFGSFLHMRNWQALGEPRRAAAARRWTIGIITTTLLLILLGVLLPEERWLSTAVRGSSVVLLIAWYYGGGRAQARFVRARFGEHYPRRGWTRPILAALGIGAGLFASLMVGVFMIAYSAARLASG